MGNLAPLFQIRRFNSSAAGKKKPPLHFAQEWLDSGVLD
jgi:hypothetical protein